MPGNPQIAIGETQEQTFTEADQHSARSRGRTHGRQRTCGPRRVPGAPEQGVSTTTDPCRSQNLAVPKQEEQGGKREDQDGQPMQQLHAQNAGPSDHQVPVDTAPGRLDAPQRLAQLGIFHQCRPRCRCRPVAALRKPIRDRRAPRSTMQHPSQRVWRLRARSPTTPRMIRRHDQNRSDQERDDRGRSTGSCSSRPQSQHSARTP